MKLRIYSDIKVHFDDRYKTTTNVVYKITFPNNSVYIGATSQELRNRIIHHCSHAFSESDRRFDCLKNSLIREFREFTVDVLYVGSEYNEKEKQFIAIQREKGNCINVADGGIGASGYERSDVTKQRISKSKYKRVLEYDINGNFVKEYNSLMDVAIEKKCSISYISMLISGKRLNKDYKLTF